MKVSTLICLSLCLMSVGLSYGQKMKNNRRVAICHKGQTIYVSKSAVKDHIEHGDLIGTCADNQRDYVAICHVKSQNPYTVMTIRVPEEEVDAYLSRGDKRGPCFEEDSAIRITICHIVSSDPKKTATITIARSELREHIGHGDGIGACDKDIDADLVTICHITSVNPLTTVTLKIKKRDLPEHIGHGDRLGICTP